MHLQDLWVGGLTQDLKQVLITDEAVLWEGGSLLLGGRMKDQAEKEKREEEGDAKSRQS